MKKVLLTTVFSGYNYGSSLQALAGKIILQDLGFDCQLVAMKSLIKGRDIRLKKIVTIFLRSFLLNGKSGFKTLSTYQKSYNKTMVGDSMTRFDKFTKEHLQPRYLSWRYLKKAARESVACFAGSDQIWNSSAMYIDPMYYLRFAPIEKRVAFAPSFGRDFVADYNKKKMSLWIRDFSYISVREDTGVGLIQELTGRDAIQLVDPTLMVDGKTWKKIFGIENKASNYIVAYFLDNPSELARRAIAELKIALGCKVIGIPYKFDDLSYCDEVIPAGPIEFIDLINNANCVLTDSFHGTAFSINLHRPFYTFGRMYGTAHSQSIRVESILKKMNMLDRFEPIDVSISDKIDFAHSEAILAEERRRARSYILTTLKTIKQYECKHRNAVL